MRAPTDKRNDTIQIIVTWSCDLFWCSNCTQLLPFRKDPRHMGVECFRKAVQSVKDWPGVVGLFGGNPCTHPHFPELCAILCEEIPQQKRRGIWTNNLLGHGELVRKVFYPNGRFNLNAHGVDRAGRQIEEHLPGKLIHESDKQLSWHSSLLLDWRDMGMEEAQWIKHRERCDINQDWSAGIAERDGEPYAYFCEIAAALDGIRGENNGILALPGWWRKKMDAFSHQVTNCCDRGCGVPLRRLGHLDREDIYDVSPSWSEVVSAKNHRPTIQIHEDMPVGCPKATDYMRYKVR